MSQAGDDELTRAVAVYLAAGMPAKHGLSVDTYVARCRAVWEACETDETCRYKVLIDRLHVETLGIREFGSAAYVDPRARATTEVEQPASSEVLQCVAMGTVPLSSLLTGDDTTQAAVDDLNDLTKESEFGLWMIAVLDVLGFERMYRRVGPQRMKAMYEQLIAAARACTDTRAVGMHSFGDGSVPTLFQFEVSFAYFSDTLLLWAPLNETLVSPFLARCADVFLEALSLGIPLRGAVAVGEAVLNQRDGVVLGTPLIDAARLEQAQDWIGVALTSGCRSVLSWLDSSLVTPYTAPCKLGTNVDLPGGLVLDWPRRARSRQMDARAALAAIQPSESHRKYYDHARAFIEHSGRTARWNREDHIPISPRFLTRSIIRTRLDGTPPPPEAAAMLDSMALNRGEEVAAAACFRALMDGTDLPAAVATLPDGMRDHVRFVQEVLADDFIDIDEVAMAAVEQRQGIPALTRRHEGYLALAPTERNETWQGCIPILRAIADGSAVPAVPDELPAEVQRILRQARDAALGHTAPVDMEALISGVVWATTMERALSDLNVKRLDVLLRRGPPWNAVAGFLRAIAEGRDPEVDLEQFDEGAVSTIRVVRKILGWQDAVRRSVEDALRALPPVDIVLLHHVAVGVIAALRGESVSDLDAMLVRLDSAGSPHDAVARQFRRLLAERRAVETLGALSTEVGWYVRLTTAFALQERLQQSPVEYMFSVAYEAQASGRGLRLYEQAVFILLGSTSDELKTLVNYLGSFATSDVEPEIPSSMRSELRGAIETLREGVRSAKAGMTVKDLVEAALGCRRGSARPEIVDSLRGQRDGSGPEASIARFLLGVIEAPTLPAIDRDLDDDTRQLLLDVGVQALCGQRTLKGLSSAVLEARFYGTPLDEGVEEAIAGLAASDEPFHALGEFLGTLAARQLWPAIPPGVPRRTLTLLASARHHASEFARRVVAVGRRQGGTESRVGDDAG